MKVTHSFSLDLAKPNPLLCLNMMQNDKNSRALSAKLFQDGTPWNIPPGTSVALAYKKPNGGSGLYSNRPNGSPAWAISGSGLTMEILPPVLTVPGEVLASLILTQQEDSLATFPLYIQVAENPYSGGDDYKSTSEYKAKGGKGISTLGDTPDLPSTYEAQVLYTAMHTNSLLGKIPPDKIRNWYSQGLWTTTGVKEALERGVISETDYQEIVKPRVEKYW